MARARGKRKKRSAFRDPKSLAAIVIGLGAVAYLLHAADIKEVGAEFVRFPLMLLPVVFGLLICREGVRTVEWRTLLAALACHVSWPHTAESIVAGDAAQILPGGLLLQNFVLRQTEGAAVSRSLAGTMIMMYLEAIVSLLVLAIVPVPGWGWLRPAAVVAVVGFSAFLALLSRRAVVRWLKEHCRPQSALGLVVVQLEHFLEGMEDVWSLPVLLRATLLTALYLGFTVATLYVISHAYHVPQIGWAQAAIIYALTLALVVLIPIPTDWGISEGAGTAMFAAYGVPIASGLTIMLILRFVVLLASLLLAAGLALAFPRDIRLALRHGPPGRRSGVPRKLLELHEHISATRSPRRRAA